MWRSLRLVDGDGEEAPAAAGHQQLANAVYSPFVAPDLGVRLTSLFGNDPKTGSYVRSLLHMESDADRRTALRAVHRVLEPGGRFVFDVFAPAPDDITETDGRWIEREPGIFERADWDEDARRLVLSVRGRGAETSLSLAWVSVTEWRELLAEEGFQVEGLYGWFDRRPWAGHEDSIWVCTRK